MYGEMDCADLLLRRGVGSGVGFCDCDLSLCGGIYLYLSIFIGKYFILSLKLFVGA